MRKLNLIIDQIVEAAPVLAKRFRSLRESIPMTAPEIMYLRWEQPAEVLTEFATDLPNADEIANIFNGHMTNG